MKVIVVALALFACIVDGYYLSLTELLQRITNSQLITCKLQDLREPAQQWTFPYNMTCGSTSDNGKTAKVDTKCLISYSCPTDPLHLKRKSEMVCKKTGKWGGVMPDCTPTTQTFDEILESFGTNKDLKEHKQVQVEKEPSVQKEFVTPTALTKESAKPTTNPPTTTQTDDKRQAKLKIDLCRRHRMCGVTTNFYGCNHIQLKKPSPRMPRLREMMVGLCRFCFTYVCNSSIVLI